MNPPYQPKLPSTIPIGRQTDLEYYSSLVLQFQKQMCWKATNQDCAAFYYKQWRQIYRLHCKLQTFFCLCTSQAATGPFTKIRLILLSCLRSISFTCCYCFMKTSNVTSPKRIWQYYVLYQTPPTLCILPIIHHHSWPYSVADSYVEVRLAWCVEVPWSQKLK